MSACSSYTQASAKDADVPNHGKENPAQSLRARYPRGDFMTRAEKLARATEALNLLVSRLTGSLPVSVYRYDLLMQSIVLLATSMRDATLAETPRERANALADAHERATLILRSKNLLSAARETLTRTRTMQSRPRPQHGNRALAENLGSVQRQLHRERDIAPRSGDERMLSITQTARALGCSRPHVSMLVDEGRLKGTKITMAGQLLIPPSSVRAYKQTLPAESDADYKKAAQEAGMYDIPDSAYVKSLRVKATKRSPKRGGRKK